VTALAKKERQLPSSNYVTSAMSRMDILSESEIQEINTNSKLVKKYSELIDRECLWTAIKKNY
jgi:hypothetical protein